MAARSGHSAPSRRAVRSLWALVLLAVLASGSLSSALTDRPAPLAGIRVAVSGLVLAACVALATRVMIALERSRRKAVANRGKRLPQPEPDEACL